MDPEDPTVIAETELLGAAASIEAAAKKLEQLKPRAKPKVHVPRTTFPTHIDTHTHTHIHTQLFAITQQGGDVSQSWEKDDTDFAVESSLSVTELLSRCH